MKSVGTEGKDDWLEVTHHLTGNIETQYHKSVKIIDEETR